MSEWTREEFEAELEALGEDQVRIKLELGIYGGPSIGRKWPVVREWLLKKELSGIQEAKSRAERAQFWDSVRSWIAIGVSLLSLIIAAAALYRPK